ncbi:glyoxylase-like metal-dependent hydrolase (beta-lactamase superfamily II) [Anaerosolibacter carboniphilus]|uniref:Glyoxylase-like metal-dependent hydrolase (Beta-lactamase superfamily II) n=1 Tax=Anaerosolibacter carboniphilus TaxID=1417629 RepID=A0A841KW37_9FIRM|nr:MBL fold metallo-hydrolase [Anaerosolibacter carboniphilus]MBB6214399.1 glyoxylase-like metal-dependent hydrolase (beta-lactamase superfamily II) [Anaerosolibacter carboniphilus]
MIQVYPNIYQLEIPLPNNPLKAINSYIIVSEDRNLIIDTGFNIEICRDALMKGVQELGIDLKKTNLLITHLHSDHSGLAAALNQEGVKVYAGAIDGNMINEMTKREYWEKFEAYNTLFGLGKDGISFEEHPGYKYSPKKPIDFDSLREGDILDLGEYVFQVVDIPGHTPGHIGLYERKHKLFFGGDHILDKITPNIAFWGFDQDILSVYFNSLKKVYGYDIDYLFTAHRNVLRDHKRRIDELLQHHKKRLDEIMEIIKNERRTVRDIAARMHWDLRYDTWEDFPGPQKWFAAGEAMSHLEHLVSVGAAEKAKENGILYYQQKPSF